MSLLQLVDRIRSGRDPQGAQEELYRRVRAAALLDRLRRKIPARVRSRVDEEDVPHAAFIQGMASLDRFEAAGENSFLAWLYQVAKNLLLSMAKRRSAQAVHFAADEHDIGPRESRVPGRRTRVSSKVQRREWVEFILDQLKVRDAEVIRLRQLDGLSFEESAARWQKTPVAIMQAYSRALKRFHALAEGTGE